MLRLAGVLAVLLPTTGCGLFRSAAAAPGSLTRAISGESEQAPPDPVAQQQALSRVALLAIEGLHKACDDFAAAAGTETARLDAARWSLRGSQLVVTLATEAQTVPALLEFLICLRLRRRMAEDRVLAQYGEAARPLITTLETLEQEGWSTCEQMIGAERTTAAHKRVDEWVNGLGVVDEQALLRRPTLDEVLKPQAEGAGFWSWLEIDPFSGLEPAAREIALMRMFGERVLFYSQQMPRLVADEVRLAALDARSQPEVKAVLANLDRVASANASIGKLADDLPALVHDEREAAIRQVGAELEAQRRGLVADLEQARAPLQQLLDASRATLGATDAAAQQLTTLVAAVDQFVARFDRPAAAPAAPPTPAAAGPPAPPFVIGDYGDAATKLADAARELTALVAQLDHNMPEVQRTIDLTVQRADATVAGAIWRALWSGLALIAAVAFATLAVRRFGRRGAAPR